MFYAKNSTKMRDNTDRLLEAVEHPERFTDAELASLLADPDMQALYDTMRKTSDLLSDTEIPDIDKEWSYFAARHGMSHKGNFLHVIPAVFNRHAAAVVTAIAVSLAVVAASIGISYTIGGQDGQQSDDTAAQEVSLPATVIKAEPDTLIINEIAQYDTVVFKNEPLDRIVSVICDYYGASAVFDNGAAKDLHLYFKWDQSLLLSDVVDQLNSFEHINIELNDSTLTID